MCFDLSYDIVEIHLVEFAVVRSFYGATSYEIRYGEFYPSRAMHAVAWRVTPL